MAAPLTIFDVAGRAMSAQMVRMNSSASNLANAGSVASSAAATYRPIKPVFKTELDRSSGLASVSPSASMIPIIRLPTRMAMSG